MSIDDSKNMFSLTKFTYSDVAKFMESQDQSKKPCTHIFLGLEYDKSGNNGDESDEGFNKCHSPYSNPDIYNKGSHRPWFAIDVSNYDKLENVSSLFANKGQFFEGNFLRLMAIQDLKESSIIAQV